MTKFKVTSYGAARTVTGSNHLLEIGGARLMLDCGLFQGGRALESLNHNPFAYEPSSLDAMILSHAHLDHAGRVPKLVKDGYKGRIYATQATRELVEYLLLDGAKLQREDFERNQRKGREATPPLYDEQDVATALERFEVIEYDKPLTLGAVKITALVAGHIPGSASLMLEADGERFVFSGDIGNIRKDVMPDAAPCPEADAILIESTYGDRDHKPFPETLAEFKSLLDGAADRGGKILIPSFALERTQDILYHIARMEETKEVPVLPVFVDSPLASKIETVYADCRDEFSDDVKRIYAAGKDPFAPAKLSYTKTVDESKALNAYKGACIIIAGAGMMNGGRILHHFINNLSDPKTTVAIVGFQPEGGLGRLLVDGESSVKIMGQQVRVNAKIATVNGFSAHADRTELLEWSQNVKGEIRLVHGEVKSMESFEAALKARGQNAMIQEPTGYNPAGGFKTEGE
jgi:metallo-beta-lactamase family protein